MKYIAILIIFLFSPFTFAKQGNYIAVGQGISSPTMTTTVNYTNGLTWENPVGVTYQTGPRLTGQIDDGDSNTGFGVELGYGNGNIGVAGGFYDPGGSGDGDGALALGVGLSGAGIGVRLEENNYTFGLLLNRTGRHRIGVVGTTLTPEGANNDVYTLGLGYSYAGDQFTFAVDASARDYENNQFDSNIIHITPGVVLRFDSFSISVSYDSYLNDDNDVFDDDLWLGVGIGGDSNWHVAFYVDYVKDWALAASYFF